MDELRTGSIAGATGASRPPAGRVWAFVLLFVAASVTIAGYTTFALKRASRSDAPSTAVRVLSAPPSQPYLMFRNLAPGALWNRVMLVPLGASGGDGYATELRCERVYYSGERGVCLVEEFAGPITKRYAGIFDERFKVQHRIALTGIPSRTRLTRDGRRAAITVFEQGHSYAEHGFSTRTTIIDTLAGRVLTDLEQFTIWRDGRRFRAVDFNFWGVTFAEDGNRFFATLASGGVRYLIEGDVDKREARVLRTGVECPSLSPDNMRIAFKHMLTSAGHWQLRVYDLRTKTEVALTTEARSVDDQVDWLDNDHVVYHITGSTGAGVHALRVDATEPPRLLREWAYSPAIVR